MGAVAEYFTNIKDAVVTTLEGLKITTRHLWTQAPITVEYPDVNVEATLPERYRGFLVNEVEICTGCLACAKACPINIIYIEVERDEATKERLLKRYDIDLGKCMYCGLCLEPCPTGSIHFTPRFEAATTNLGSLYHQFVERAPLPIYKNPKAPGGAAGDSEEEGMGVYDVVFFVLAALTVLSACVVAGSRNIVYSGFALIFTFLGVAGLYVQLAADFLAAMQVLVYVGGITVVILFAVMLTRDIAQATGTNPILNRPASLLAAAGVFAMSLVLILGSDWPLRSAVDYPPMSAPLGRALLGKYLLPFEVASLLLLGALIGAVIIARREVHAPPADEAGAARVGADGKEVAP